MADSATMASPGTANVVEGNRVSTIDDIIRRLMGTTRAEHQGWEPMQLHESDSISIHEAQKILRTGDTLVYIDFPDPELGHKLSDCRGIPYQSMVLRVSSEKLLATGSQRFKDLLGPNNQRRVLRMRKLVGKLPAGVKYVLDLTPSLEGDEQVQEMCELSVPPGVAAWWKAEAVYHVSHRLCGGHDDVCDCAVEAATEARERHMRPRTPPGASTSSTEPSPTSSPSSRDASTTKFAVRKDPKFRNIPDYCLIRHRVNIIRLLLAIESSDHDRYILLNSAPRLWTMVGLSKLFDCTNVVRDTAFVWLMASPNTEFLEVLTEEALQIGFALQLREPTRAAFKILVTERALEILADERTAGKARKTLFGRERQPLPDDLDNLVQHAGRSLAERARKLYESLAGDDVFATLQVQEFAKLKALGNASEQWKRTSDVEALRRAQFRLERALLDDFHRRLNDAMNYLGDDGYGVSIDAVLGEYVTTREPSDVPSFMAVYLCLTDEQRSLCSPAYRQLYNSWPSLPELEQAVAPGHDSNMDQLAWEYDKALVRASITYLEGPPIDASQFVFSLQSFRAEVAGALHTMNVLWADRDSEFPFLITPHLCLPEQMVELKYLPLWAEGLDDGTGGVFQEFVPPAELGPNGPGPAFHTGITMPSTADGGNDGSSVLDSDIVMVPDAPSSYSFSDLASDLARANVRDDGHTPTQSVSGESAITAIGVARSSLAANDSITETATRASESSSVVVVSRPESEVSRLEPDVSRPESDVSWPEPDVSQTESDVSRPESEADDDVTMADD